MRLHNLCNRITYAICLCNTTQTIIVPYYGNIYTNILNTPITENMPMQNLCKTYAKPMQNPPQFIHILMQFMQNLMQNRMQSLPSWQIEDLQKSAAT